MTDDTSPAASTASSRSQPPVVSGNLPMSPKSQRLVTNAINMRAFQKRYMVVQIQHVNVEWPEPEDVGMPPRPPCPKNRNFNSPEWDDYRHMLHDWEEEMLRHTKAARGRLTAKLN